MEEGPSTMRLLVAAAVCASLQNVVVAQIEVKEKSAYVSQPKDDSALTKEIYTSMHELAQFFERERRYVEDMRTVLERRLVSSEDAAAALAAYLASYEDVVGEQDEDESFLYNPLNVYVLVRHVAIGWPVVEQALNREKQRQEGAELPKRVRRLLARSKRDHVPGADDLDGVAVGIVRLHDYYKFNASSFVDEGVFETDEWKVGTTGELTVWDAFKIGVKGTNKMFLGSGIDIMIHALEKAKEDGMVTTPPFIDPLDIKVLKNLIKTAKTVHDQKLDRWGTRTPQHSTNVIPYDKRLAKKKKFASPKPKPTKLMDARIIDTRQEVEQYMQLCRGVELRPPNVTKDLTCHYESRGKPYYMYGPRKIETVSLRPHIVVIHDFITLTETKEIVQFASPKLIRSAMVGKSMNGSIDDNRVSEQSWMTEKVIAARRLTRRIDQFLDMEATSDVHSEAYQVANYGLAGQYFVHYDQSMMDKKSLQAREIFNLKMGDRLATLMGYLTDVMAGGYTVFPLVGAFVKPQRGSLVLWWNMDQAGGYDTLVRHGGCPVMIGSKWITNKWIRSHSQMFKRPCPKYTSRQIRDFRSKDPYNMQRGAFFTDP